MKKKYRKYLTIKHTFLILIASFIYTICTAQELKVMTFNIYHGEQAFNKGKSNLEEVAKLINEYKPDFVALQEVDSMTNRSSTINNGVKLDLMKKLTALTDMFGYFGKAIDFSEGGYGEGILSRYPVKNKNYQLPSPEGGEGRSLILVEYTLPGNKNIIFAGTHLCHQFEENRIAQVNAISEILNKTDKSVILCGDFNMEPYSKPYKIIDKSFIDAAGSKGNPKNTHSADNPEIRIDYIFLSRNTNWEIKKVKVINSTASDHLPVLVTLNLN